MNRRVWAVRIVGLAISGALALIAAVFILAGKSSMHWAPWLAAAITMIPLVWIVSSAAAVHERKDDPGERGILISMVLLMRAPRYLDEGILAQRATAAWGERACEDDDSFVVGDAPSFVVRAGGRQFLVNSFDTPYFPDPHSVAAQVLELRLRRIILEHQAWISVDLMGGAPSDESAYRWIGKLIAELADENCLAVFCPRIGRISVFGPSTRQTLCGPRPLSLFKSLATMPVIDAKEDDPKMRLAIAKARRRWPEFVAAFEHRTEDQHFIVRGLLCEGEQCEPAWMMVTAIENGVIYGRLRNNPVNLRSHHGGQIMRVRVEEITDWVYTKAEHVRGGFTIEAMGRTQRGNTEA